MRTQRDTARWVLRAMLDEIMRARDLTAEDQAIPALQSLLQAKRLGKRSIAILLGDCLEATTKQTDEVSLARLMALIGFAQQALCRDCRSEVGKRWKESENV